MVHPSGKENQIVRSSKRKAPQSILKFCKRSRIELDVNGNSDKNILEEYSRLVKQVTNDKQATLVQLDSVAHCITSLQKTGPSKCINIKELPNFIKVLSDIISKGVEADFNPKAQEEKMSWKLHIQKNSQAVFNCLLIFSTQDMPTELYSEDCINNILLYLKHQFVELSAQLSKKSHNKKSISMQWYESVLEKNLHLLSKLFNSRKVISAEIYNFLGANIYFAIYGHSYDVQISAILVTVRIFKKHEDFRLFILNEIFSAIRKFPESRKLSKTFIVRDSVKISMFTVLMIATIQHVADDGSHMIDLTSYKNLLKMAGMLAVSLVSNCCSGTDGYKAHRTFLEFFIMELLEVSNEPEWPASKLILQFLAKRLAEIAKDKASDQGTKILSIKILNRIAQKIMSDKKGFSQLVENVLSEDVVEMRKLFWSYLSKLNLTALNSSAKAFHQVQWLESLRQSDEGGEQKMFDICSVSTERDLEPEEARAVVFFLDTKRLNYSDFHLVFLNYILNACYDPVNKVKAVGAQCLAELISLDPHLLMRSTVSKTINVCLSTSTAAGREAVCSLIGRFLSSHPGQADQYIPHLMKALEDESLSVRRTCVGVVESLVLKEPQVLFKKDLFYKVFGLIRDEEPSIQKQVINLFTGLWFSCKLPDHLDALLEMIDTGHCFKYLRMFFEEKLKPRVVPVTDPTQTQPLTQTLDAFEKFMDVLLEEMKTKKKTLPCLKVLSIIAATYPKLLTSSLNQISQPLLEAKYSDDLTIEFLTAETMNYILPETAHPDVHMLISLRNKVAEKLSNSSSSNFSMGFLVSLIKLLKRLPNDDFILEKCFKPNLDVLEKYKKSGNTDEQSVQRALRIAVYLHKDFPEESEGRKFLETIHHFLQHAIFALCSIHSLCYLSMEHKIIMNNESLRTVIAKYLRDKSQPVLTRAVLYNILCSLKNLEETNSNIKKLGDSDTEVTSDLIQTFLKDILECVLDPRYEIRYTACLLIQRIVKLGLVMEPRLIPFIVTMCTDSAAVINNIGTELLKHTENRKIWDLSRNPQRALLMSFHFHRQSSNGLVRGFDNNGGRLEAKCDLLYRLVQEDVTKRRRLIEAVLRELGTDSETTIYEKLYFVDHLACFTYKYMEEVIFLLEQIKNLRLTISVPDNSDPIKSVKKYYGCYLLEPLMDHLHKRYGINDQNRLKDYSSPNKDVIPKRAQVSVVIPKNMLPGTKSIKTLFQEIFVKLKRQEEIETSSQSSSSTNESQKTNSTIKTPKRTIKKTLASTGKTPQRQS